MPSARYFDDGVYDKVVTTARMGTRVCRHVGALTDLPVYWDIFGRICRCVDHMITMRANLCTCMREYKTASVDERVRVYGCTYGYVSVLGHILTVSYTHQTLPTKRIV